MEQRWFILNDKQIILQNDKNVVRFTYKKKVRGNENGFRINKRKF